MSPDSPRTTVPPLCAAGVIGNLASNWHWNASREIDAAATGDAWGEATGDAAGVAQLGGGLAATVGSEVGVVRIPGVGVDLLPLPPQAAMVRTIASKNPRGNRFRVARIDIKSQISCTPSQRVCAAR